MRTNIRSQDPISVFDIGDGPVVPDEVIMKTGRTPVEIYFDEEHYRREKTRVFEQSWLLVGRTNEFTEPGSFVVREILGRSILLVRAQDNVLRAFHNACSHRLSKLVWEPEGKLTTIHCPYHAWAYDLDGRLKFVPGGECFPNLDMERSGLSEIPCDSFGIFVFINLNVKPKLSLKEFLGGWGERMDGLPWEDFSVVGRATAELPCNWKLGIENAGEAYHAFSLHKRTLASTVPKDNLFLKAPSLDYYGLHVSNAVITNTNPRLNPAHVMQEFYREHAAIPLAGGRRASAADARVTFSTHPGINQHKIDNHGVDNSLLFPNAIMAFSGFGWLVQRFWPTSPTTCVWEAEWGMPKPNSWADRFGQDQTLALTRDIIAEDLPNIIYQQKMLQSGAKTHEQFGTEEMLLRRLCANIVALTRDEPTSNRLVAAE
jgi:phenylpropionate dioxygenase-like ring-hydroxylating dioxygenase large terminal subunit